MKTLPSKTRTILIAVIAGGALTALLLAGSAMPSETWQVRQLAIFLVLSVLVGGKNLPLASGPAAEDRGTVSLGFLVTFAAVLALGPGDALLIGGIGTLCECLYPRPRPWFQTAFNVSVEMLAAAGSGLVFQAVSRGAGLADLSAFPAVIGAALTYYMVNTGLVSCILASVSGQNATQIWQQKFLWMGPGYLACACAGALGVFLCRQHAVSLLLFTSPIIYLIYNSYAVHIARAGEKQEHTQVLAATYLHAVKTLARTLALTVDAKDPYTHQHVVRVQYFAMAIARRMDLDEETLEGLSTGALLHDIGKIGIPDAVLLKPGRLNDTEFAEMRRHPEIGASILGQVDFPWPVLPVVRHHHEKWDGTGYPDGLQGENIPLTARILAVADVYDALTSQRAYRRAWSHERALAEIQRCAGTHFDPVIVDAFADVIDATLEDMAIEGILCSDIPIPDEDVPVLRLVA